ncbi:MAG: FkbM family methyltransferase [Rhodospirillales bacterium]|nr:FkbM family methyltransferase [Rhodospirillales bacterium]
MTRQRILLARMAQWPILSARRLIGLGPELRARRGGVNWVLDLREGIDFSIFLLGAFERSTLATYEKMVMPGMTVLDIGANSGAHTLHLARLVGDSGQVIAFEPTKWAIDKLNANINSNPDLASRIVVCQTMLSDTDGVAVPSSIHSSWPLAPGEDVHPLLRARDMSTTGAVSKTLDSIMKERDVMRVDFIKMDVDGYECQVLDGMSETLEKFAPPILMEFSPYGFEEKGGSLENLMHFMKGIGYRFYRLGENMPLPSEAAGISAYASTGGGFNVIAKPKSI